MLTRRRFARRLLPIAVCLFAASAARARSFTIEQVLSSPLPSEPVASKRGDRVAWVFDAQGRRNVWIAEAPQWRGRQLTRYDADDGQELTDLVFSEDGRCVAFAQTVMLVRRLRDQGVEFEQPVFPEEVHDFPRHDHRVQAYHATADFFDRHLKPGAQHVAATGEKP